MEFVNYYKIIRYARKSCNLKNAHILAYISFSTGKKADFRIPDRIKYELKEWYGVEE